MKIGAPVYASLLMSIGACFALWKGEQEFSYDKQLQSRIERVSQRLMQEKLKSELVLARLEDFKQEVAFHIANEKKLQEQSQLRDLASVIPHYSSGEKNIERSSQHYFKMGRQAFDEGRYEQAIQRFLDTVSKYPDSSLQLEASYLLVRSFYITGNKQEALAWSEKMLRNFPESTWTAKAMIVMAHIYIDQNRKNEALDVYQTVLNTFKEKELQEEVKKQLVEMGL